MSLLKKFSAILLLPTLCLSIFSCGFRMEQINSRYAEKDFIENYIKLFSKCIETRDTILLKSLFSTQTIEDVPEIDNSIKMMVDFIGSGDISYEFYSAAGPNDSTSISDGRIIKKLMKPFTLCVNEKKYRIAMQVLQYDSLSEANVGITSIYIVEDELFSKVCGSEYVYWGGGIWNPGITIDNEETIYRG